MNNFIKHLFFLVIFLSLFDSCLTKDADSQDWGIEFIEIKLDQNIAFPKAEFSGMAWYQNELVLLPQYPDRFDSQNKSYLFSISKADITNYIKSGSKQTIEYKKIELKSENVENSIEGFQGYEAIAFNGQDVYLTIEAEKSGQMSAYIVCGKFDEKNSIILLNKNSLKEIPIPVNLANMAFETLLIINDRVVAIYEANGKNVNPQPYAVAFDLNLQNFETIEFPALEYRITDATGFERNQFWVINYLYKGDKNLLNPATRQNSTSNTVERLVKFQFENNEIKVANRQPINIKLNPKDGNSRNWEGIVKFDSLGFLLITDKFPKTIMAYLPFSLGKHDLFVFEKNEKFGFKNAIGITVIESNYKFAQEFTDNGTAAVVDDSGWVYINKLGKKLIRPHVVDNGPDYFSNGLARFKSKNKYGYFEKNGTVVIKAQFDFVRPFTDSLAAICEGCQFEKQDGHTKISGGKWEFINLKGEIVIPLIYDKVSDFDNGSAKVYKNGIEKIISKNQ